MVDLTEHPYIALCDVAICSPDSRHLRGESYKWLADRHNDHAPCAEHVTADQVREWEDDFYEQVNSAAVVEVTTRDPEEGR